MPAAAQQGPVRRMSIDDAVATALEQNLDLQVQRINPQLQDLTTAQFRAAYTPNFVSTVSTGRSRRSRRRASSPAAAAGGGVTSGQSIFNFGVASLTNWYGGSYDVRWNNTRSTTNNLFQSFNPQLNSIVQRDLHPAAAAQLQDRRRAPAVAGQPEEPRRSPTRSSKQSIALTVRNVRNAYYDLMGAIATSPCSGSRSIWRASR